MDNNQISLDDIAKQEKENNIIKARKMIQSGEWVPTKITPPLNKGYYMITVCGYDHPFIARFMPSNEPGLGKDGGYWFDSIYTLNDYGVIAWKPAPSIYMEVEKNE